MSDVKNKYRYVVKKIKDDEYVDQTFIGLTEEAGRYQGVIYKYGRVGVAEEENPNGTLNFQFEYDILVWKSISANSGRGKSRRDIAF